jgi:hypothetical protein
MFRNILFSLVGAPLLLPLALAYLAAVIVTAVAILRSLGGNNSRGPARSFPKSRLHRS